MKFVAYAVALVLALAAAAGCGSSTSSEGTPRGASDDVTVQEDRPAAVAPDTTPPQPEASGQHDQSGKTAAVPLPRGVPLNTQDPRVERAIADLLHPKKTDKGQEAPEDDRSHQGKDEDRGGVIERILRDLRKQTTQQPQTDDHPSHHEDGLGILEMLK
jgi:hypothetical protein